MNYFQSFNAKLYKIHNDKNMGFWDNVSAELEYLGMTNKALAEKAGFAASNITKGIRCKSSPSAETAVRISRVLGVSVEYLVSGMDIQPAAPLDTNKLLLRYRKYAALIDNLETLPEYERKPVIDMVAQLRKSYEESQSVNILDVLPSSEGVN